MLIKNLIITKKMLSVINAVRKIITKINIGQKQKLTNYKYMKKIRIKSLTYSNKIKQKCIIHKDSDGQIRYVFLQNIFNKNK